MSAWAKRSFIDDEIAFLGIRGRTRAYAGMTADGDPAKCCREAHTTQVAADVTLICYNACHGMSFRWQGRSVHTAIHVTGESNGLRSARVAGALHQHVWCWVGISCRCSFIRWRWSTDRAFRQFLPSRHMRWWWQYLCKTGVRVHFFEADALESRL
jgi:hypothetical protein